MSDRLKTDLYTIWDRGRHGISWEDSWVQDFLDDVAPDLVSEIRSSVESGTIKGEVASLDGANVGDGVPDDEIELTFYMDREKGVEWFRRNFQVLVIPVSDGGEDRP